MGFAFACALAALVVTTIAIPSAGNPNWQIGQRVQTSSGVVEGHAAEKVPSVSEYLGIPYVRVYCKFLIGETNVWVGKTSCWGAEVGSTAST